MFPEAPPVARTRRPSPPEERKNMRLQKRLKKMKREMYITYFLGKKKQIKTLFITFCNGESLRNGVRCILPFLGGRKFTFVEAILKEKKNKF